MYGDSQESHVPLNRPAEIRNRKHEFDTCTVSAGYQMD